MLSIQPHCALNMECTSSGSCVELLVSRLWHCFRRSWDFEEVESSWGSKSLGSRPCRLQSGASAWSSRLPGQPLRSEQAILWPFYYTGYPHVFPEMNRHSVRVVRKVVNRAQTQIPLSPFTSLAFPLFMSLCPSQRASLEAWGPSVASDYVHETGSRFYMKVT